MCIFLKLWFRRKPQRLLELLIMSAGNEKVYYAVGRGKEIGIFDSWKECKAQTDGFCNAKYRKFYSLEEAKEFVNFWKNYSTPVKGESETEDSVSSDLNQKGNVTNSGEDTKIEKHIPAKSLKSKLTSEQYFVLGNKSKNTSLSVSSCTLPVLLKKNNKKLNSQDCVEPKKQSDVLGQGMLVESSKLIKNQDGSQKCDELEVSNSQNSTLGSYSNEFSVSKPFTTSTQIEQEVLGSGDADEVSERITTCLNMLESAFGVTAVQNATELKRLKNDIKPRKVNRGSNTNITPQMEPAENGEEVCEDKKPQIKNQPAETQLATQQEPSLVQQSPSKVTCVHLQCSSPHSASMEGRVNLDVLALNLRLDSFEKRFDACLKEIGGISTEVSHIMKDIKELKEALQFISHSGATSSPRKGKDGLMQTTLSFGPGYSSSNSGSSLKTEESAEPEKKRIRTMKRKLSRSDSSSEDRIDRLLNSLKAERVDLSTFTVDDDDFVVVYTDGSSQSNGTQEAKAGIGIWFGDDHPLNVAEPVCGPATNIIAEIQAARVAIQLAIRAGVKKLKIHTDSEFLINCATKWIHRWKKNGWTLSGGGPVKNRKELEKLDLFASKITVLWEKVPAHSKIKGNEIADRLANEGASRYER